MGSSDIAHRFKAKFSRRRRESGRAPSLASNPSRSGEDPDSVSLRSQQAEHERDHEVEIPNPVRESSSRSAIAETPAPTPSQQQTTPEGISTEASCSQQEHERDDGDGSGLLNRRLSITAKPGEHDSAPVAPASTRDTAPPATPAATTPLAPTPVAPPATEEPGAPAPPAAETSEAAPQPTSTAPEQGLTGAVAASGSLASDCHASHARHASHASHASGTPGNDLHPYQLEPLSTESEAQTPPFGSQSSQSSQLSQSSQSRPPPPLLTPVYTHLSNLESINEDSSAEPSPSLAVQSLSDDADNARDSLTPLATSPPTTVATSFSQPPAPQTPPTSQSTPRPPAPPRRQSLLSNKQTTLINTLLHDHDHSNEDGGECKLPISHEMVLRKVWVKRPNGGPTMVTISEADLVDDMRDMILRKYVNSLARTFDSPDLHIRLFPRDQGKDRILKPEEQVCRTLDAYYPGGQTVDEALLIDAPRRLPKASPRLVYSHGPYHATEDGRPSETGEGYFPPVGGAPSPHLPANVQAPTNVSGPHSIAVIGTGHIPPIPSPGGTRSRAYRERQERPRLGRTHAASPTIVGSVGPGTSAVGAVAAGTAATTAVGAHGTQQPPQSLPPTSQPQQQQSQAQAQSQQQQQPSPQSQQQVQHFNTRLPRSRTHSNSSDPPGNTPVAPSIPTPPAAEAPQKRVSTPPPRVSSPRPSSTRLKKPKKDTETRTSGRGVIGNVPPISVLIVEDNPINLKLLEAFVKRLKVRWKTAMNGRDAVTKWRKGGYHLVLMDIQLPVMNGLDATREIRRLERVNSIGVFSSTPGDNGSDGESNELKESDRLKNLALFKSPVIIVALTASSLQSDRHEALAAGCNDFLTKPVNFVWLERKVKEWGCMQALIDYDGWRKWKEFSLDDDSEATKKAVTSKPKSKKNRLSVSSVAA